MKLVESQTLLQSLVQTNCTLRKFSFCFYMSLRNCTKSHWVIFSIHFMANDTISPIYPWLYTYSMITDPCPLLSAGFPTGKECVIESSGFTFYIVLFYTVSWIVQFMYWQHFLSLLYNWFFYLFSLIVFSYFIYITIVILFS